jgi:hypothetical protein
VVSERDLDGAIVVEFGGAGTGDFVAFVEPAQVKKTVERLYSSSRLACMAP